MISRYMHEPSTGHWAVVKWILRYIEGTINVELVFEKNTNRAQECTGYDDSNMHETLTHDRACLHIVPSTSELALDFTVYYRFVDNRS